MKKSKCVFCNIEIEKVCKVGRKSKFFIDLEKDICNTCKIKFKKVLSTING